MESPSRAQKTRAAKEHNKILFPHKQINAKVFTFIIVNEFSASFSISLRCLKLIDFKTARVFSLVGEANRSQTIQYKKSKKNKVSSILFAYKLNKF